MSMKFGFCVFYKFYNETEKYIFLTVLVINHIMTKTML